MSENYSRDTDSEFNISTKEWKAELDKTSERYHVIGAWIAIIFDPVFAFTDYLNIPGHFAELLMIRIGVSVLTFINYLFFQKYRFRSYWLVLVPFLLISFQNSYTFMLIDESGILGHSLNYIALFIGGGMFILWPLQFSVFVVLASIFMTYLFVNQNEAITGDAFWINGGLLKLIIEIFMIVLIYSRYRLSKKEIISRLRLEKSKNLLSEQKEIISLKNEQLMDSLQYAKRIQSALLGDQQRITEWFNDGFVFFKAKDVVSGDFYWLFRHESENVRIIMAADCTGHGVPAALMTVLGNSILTDIVEHKRIYMPDKILKELDTSIIKFLDKHRDEFGAVNDGMDISVLSFIDDKIYFSAAKNPLVMVKNGKLEQIKGSKFAIGGFGTNREEKEFELHEIDASEGDVFYLFSDGFQDQFGGPKGKKYMTKRFRETLFEISGNEMTEQKAVLDRIFEEWKGNTAQTDDVLLVGVKL